MGTVYYGDNLEILREHVKDETVDLVYLDPPFNSNASYNVLFRARGEATKVTPRWKPSRTPGVGKRPPKRRSTEAMQREARESVFANKPMRTPPKCCGRCAPSCTKTTWWRCG